MKSEKHKKKTIQKKKKKKKIKLFILKDVFYYLYKKIKKYNM